jgi:hypothetical protein
MAFQCNHRIIEFQPVKEVGRGKELLATLQEGINGIGLVE